LGDDGHEEYENVVQTGAARGCLYFDEPDFTNNYSAAMKKPRYFAAAGFEV